MSNKFRVTLYTKQRLSKIETFSILWRLLDDQVVKPQRYDTVERAKFSFGPDIAEAAFQLYQSKKLFFVRGGKDNFLGMFNEQPSGLAIWMIWLDIRAMQGRKAEHWLKWLFHLCEELPILYGSGCAEAEYDAKHLQVTVLPDGKGTATGAVGISISEFYQYLPGLYWLTIFGPELVQAFDQSKLTTLPSVNVSVLGSQQVAIRLDEPVIPENMQQRMRTESQLADRLGANFFFDRNRADLSYEPISQLIEVLNKIRPE